MPAIPPLPVQSTTQNTKRTAMTYTKTVRVLHAPRCKAGGKTRHLDEVRLYGLDGLRRVSREPLSKNCREALGEHRVRIYRVVDETPFRLCRNVNS